MASFDQYKHYVFTTVVRKYYNTPCELKNRYLDIAQPSYYTYTFFTNNNDEAEFFISQARWNASHITEGFKSKNEVKDDLKALIIKPALLTFEAGYHGVMFTLKLIEVCAHLLAALIEFCTKKPDDTRSFFQRMNVFADKAPAFEVPQQDLKNAGDAALDAAESLIKLIVYPMVATAELYVQSGSFLAKCLFSLDDSIGDKFNAAAKCVREAMPNVQFA